jgi:hypothetical protein
MNWSSGLFRAWLLGSTLWLVGWSAHLLLESRRLPAETTGCEAVQLKGSAEPLTDDETRCHALLRWDDVFVFQANDCFELTESYIETFVENPALDIKPDRTLMLRYERKSFCQYGYRTTPFGDFYVGHPLYATNAGENVRNQVATTVGAFGIPAISFVLGCALLWVRRGFKRD